MAAQMEKLNLNNLDKSGWKTYRFEQIAKSISERVDPNNTDLKIYVGLEHLDAENIHIKRYGTPDDVDGQKLRCYPGDVIFGKRRAYQRKAAVVDFDGFCSAHAMVLRANPGVMDPQLFPFFLHSDTFMHRAIDISVGSLSPTINWGTLKTQEFLLPPKDQQAKLAELLWGMDAVVEKEIIMKDHLIALKKTFLRELFLRQWNKSNLFFKEFEISDFPMIKLSEVCLQSMFGPRFSSNLYDNNGNVASLRTTDIDNDGNINLDTMPKASIPEDKFKDHFLKTGDLVISRSGTCGLTAVFDDYKIPVIPAAFLIRFRILDNVNPNYLKLFFNSDIGRAITMNLASGAVQKNLTSKALLNIAIPIPNHRIQSEILKFVNGLYIEGIQTQITASKSLQKSLINQIF